MSKKTYRAEPARRVGVMGALLVMATSGAIAQGAPGASDPSTGSAAQYPSASFGPSDPSPYFIGGSQAFTYDSNVFRVAEGPSDSYSSTALFGGFNQQIGRQRVFGSANVAANRYLDQSALNNVSYGLAAGADLETVNNLSGNLAAGLNRNLSAPVTTSALTTPRRNIATTENVDVLLRWGGVSLLTLEGSYGYSRIDYSAPESVASESSRNSGGLTLFYRPGGPLRVGVGGHVSRTRTPKALFDTTTGAYQSNAVQSRNLDLLVDYGLSGTLAFNSRLSYTEQTNSGIAGVDFSGATGSVGLVYHATGKIDVSLQAARDAGYDSSFANTYAVVQSGSGVVLSPVSILYQNNRLTDSVSIGATYAATAKIGVRTGARYSRARLVTATFAPASSATAPETTDVTRRAFVGASYAITRNLGASCDLSHESRSVSGGLAFSYRATVLGCSAQIRWP